MKIFLTFFAIFAKISALNSKSAGGLPTYEDIRRESKTIEQDLKKWRRSLHQIPELMYQEHKTSEFIQKTLSEMGIKFTTGWGVNTRQDRFEKGDGKGIPGDGGTGIVADIGINQPRTPKPNEKTTIDTVEMEPIVMLRADIDALPIQEELDLPFASQHPGKMHACGHDAHATWLLGAAKILKAKVDKGELPAGIVRLVWQPAEEGGAGAARMIEEGVLNGVTRAFGFHVDPNVPSGEIGGVPGTFMFSADFFKFEVIGRGGHVAEPWLAIDPVAAAAAVVTSLNEILPKFPDDPEKWQRQIMENGLVSVPVMHGGEFWNVIDDQVMLEGTIRAPTAEILSQLKIDLQAKARAAAQQHGCEATNFQFLQDPFPATHNDENLWKFVEKTVEVKKSGPYLFGDDHGFYSQKVPSAYLFIGTGGESEENRHELWGTSHEISANGFSSGVPVHTSKFNLDEAVLHQGAALMSHLALRSLVELNQVEKILCNAKQ